MTSPAPGSALQGAVAITGSTDLPGFASAEVDFSYSGGGTSEWFLIAQSQSSVKNDSLAVWDTSKIADGDYALRVQVTLTDGSTVQKLVTGLRVRNYTAIETDTPAPLIKTQAIISPTATIPIVTATPRPTPTGLPGNPASMIPGALEFNMILGVMAVVIVFGLLGLYRWLKANSRNR